MPDNNKWQLDADRPYESLPVSNGRIRLLELYPGEFNDPLRGHFFRGLPTRKEDTPLYEAVSYVWGTSPPHLPLLIDGYCIPITAIVDQMLRQLRLTKQARYLWIDAICINQDDSDERARQVKAMPEIYTNADRVKIWLGPASRYSKQGLEVLEYFLGPINGVVPPWEGQNPGCILEGLKEIMDRDWFTRVWVVQEAAVARSCSFICGPDQVTWHINNPYRIRKAIRKIKYAEVSPSWEQNGLKSVKLDRILNVLEHQYKVLLGRYHEIQPSPLDLLDLMHESRDKKCSDPRDRIYALVGLAGVQTKGLVDYQISAQDAFDRLKEVVHLEDDLSGLGSDSEWEDSSELNEGLDDVYDDHLQELKDCATDWLTGRIHLSKDKISDTLGRLPAKKKLS